MFDAGTNKYMVMSKSNGDRVMVRRIDGGTIGAATTDFPWDYLKMIYEFGGVTSVPDYQHINFTRGYSIGAKTYVLTVASEKLTDYII